MDVGVQTSVPSSDTDPLGDLGQLTQSFWASISPSANNSNPYLPAKGNKDFFCYYCCEVFSCSDERCDRNITTPKKVLAESVFLKSDSGHMDFLQHRWGPRACGSIAISEQHSWWQAPHRQSLGFWETMICSCRNSRLPGCLAKLPQQFPAWVQTGFPWTHTFWQEVNGAFQETTKVGCVTPWLKDTAEQWELGGLLLSFQTPQI